MRREAIFQAANEADPRMEHLDENQLRQALADERRLRKEVITQCAVPRVAEEVWDARSSISIKLVSTRSA